MPVKDTKGEIELCVKVFTNALKTLEIRSRDKCRHQATNSPEMQPSALIRETPSPVTGEDLTFSFGSAQTLGPRAVPCEETLDEA